MPTPEKTGIAAAQAASSEEAAEPMVQMQWRQKVLKDEDASQADTSSSTVKSVADQDSESGQSKEDAGATPHSPVRSVEEGEANEDSPPVPKEEPHPDSAPPLPDEPVPGSSSSCPDELVLNGAEQQSREEDGWEYHWNPNTNSYWFYNHFTQIWQQDNPRLPTTANAAAAPAPLAGPSTSAIGSVANGYNPAIHGDYDPNAWYAVAARSATEQQEVGVAASSSVEKSQPYSSGGFFNRQTGQWQAPEQNAHRHSDEAKSRRQMQAFFDVDAAANMHDGRSLKAERAGQKPSRAELKAFKEKRRAKKEEKRRAWLRD